MKPQAKNRSWFSTAFIAAASLFFIGMSILMGQSLLYEKKYLSYAGTLIWAMLMGFVGLRVVCHRIKQRIKQPAIEQGQAHQEQPNNIQASSLWELLRNPHIADSPANTGMEIKIKPVWWVVLVFIFSAMVIYGLLYLGR
jgi:hypothetical protein